MAFRDRAYASYVSAYKRHSLSASASPHWQRNVRATAWALRGWLPAPRDDARVVDLGCGPGVLLAVYRALGFTNIVGVDRSQEQARIARTVAPRIVVGDVFEFLAERRACFTLISAFDLLEHLTRDEGLRLLELIASALRPGGTLLLQTPNGDSPFAGSVIWSDVTHETQFTAVSLRHLLELAGFSDIEFREAGPVPVNAAGSVRLWLWRLVRLAMMAVHYVETGSPSTGIYTRVLRCKAVRPAAARAGDE
jgi:SAM-dependent methyltransferase